MLRGKRKSPFIGSSEAVASASGPILYYRYTNLSDILLDGSAPLPASDAPQDGAAKKKPKREKAKKPKPEGEANGAAQQQQQQQPKRQKKPKGPRKLAPEERVSGPGNAQEALKMREALGIVAATPEEIAEAEAAAARAARGPTFAFGFGLGGSAGTPAAVAAPATAAKPATAKPAPAAKLAAPAADGDSTSSSSDDESDSGSESEPEEGPAAAAAAAAGGSSSESDSSDSESEQDEEEEEAVAAAGGGSSSESEEPSSESESESDEEEAPAAAGGAAPAQQARQAAPARNVPQQAQQPVAAAAAAAAAPLGDEEEDSEYVPRRVYVGGMPFSYSEDKVHEYWSYCGEIESMDCMTFPDTGRFRGIAFITFTTQEGYDAALACDGEQCDGQTLKVQRCKWSPKERAVRDRQRAQQAQQQGRPTPAAAQAVAPVQQPQQQGTPGGGAAPTPQQQQAEAARRGGQHSSPAPKTEGYNVAYVGNVAFEADEKELQRLFEGYNVTKVRLHTDKETGRSKGFAHVHFKDEESLDRALALDGTSLFGRKIRVGYAQPKKA